MYITLLLVASAVFPGILVQLKGLSAYLTCSMSFTAVFAQSATIVDIGSPNSTLAGEVIGVGDQGTTYVLSVLGVTSNSDGEALTRKH